MAKVTGALFSLTAKGTLKNSLTYSMFRGVMTVKGNRMEQVGAYHFRTKPTYSQTENQLAVRDTFRKGIKEWRNLTPSQKNVYHMRVKNKKLTAISLFIKEFLIDNFDLIRYRKYWLFGIGHKINFFMFQGEFDVGLLLSTVVK